MSDSFVVPDGSEDIHNVRRITKREFCYYLVKRKKLWHAINEKKFFVNHTYASNWRSDKSEFEQADHFTPRWDLTFAQHGHKRTTDYENRAEEIRQREADERKPVNAPEPVFTLEK